MWEGPGGKGLGVLGRLTMWHAETCITLNPQTWGSPEGRGVLEAAICEGNRYGKLGARTLDGRRGALWRTWGLAL